MNYSVGRHGGRAKCYRFYEDVVECARDAGRNDHYWKCEKEREDYLECLHNKKLVRLF